MATELAKAYVQIIPSAKGIGKKIGEEVGGEDPGKTIGESMVSSIKKALAAAGIGMAVKKIFSDAFSNGSELQQNLGGSEAVFGEYARSIQESSQTAYKNMGMSASDYMATANKMGSLFQGSGIEQQKALDLTTSAMQRAADVASVMGIDMNSAMESIAGAAKGNFTMMDNLGVAMNATTLQAYALKKGINFKWNTASNAEKAELAMKMFMDRTSQHSGNFAREAEETWSGSIGAVKAAYQDLMGNLMLGNDIGVQLNNLATSLSTFIVGNFIPAVMNLVSGLPGAIITLITTLAPELAESASGIADHLLVGIQSRLPEMLNEGANVIVSFVNGIMSRLPSVITASLNMLSSFVTTILSQLPSILNTGKNLLLKLVEGIISNFPNIVSSAAEGIARFLAEIARNLPSILQSGITIIGQLAAGLILAIPDIVGKIPTIVSSIVNAFLNQDWGNTGWNIIRGIANGLSSAGHMLWDAVKGVLGSFKSKVLSFFGIHSPSTWGEYVGNMVDTGMAKGFVGNAKKLTDALSNSIFPSVEVFEDASLYRTLDFGQSGASSKQSTRNVRIEVPLTMDGREITRAIVNLMDEQLAWEAM